MKLIAQVKLNTTPEQNDALKRTLKQANEARNYLSEQAWETKTFGQYQLHKLSYHVARSAFPSLSSQVVVRAIADVADSYKLDRKTKRTFKPFGAISYDERILHWYTDRQEVSIWTVGGRLHIPYQCGERQRLMLKTLQGQADLVYRNGKFYLHQACNVETPDPNDPAGWLGIDLGVVNLAVDSDGDTFSGDKVETKRRWHEDRRKALQSVGTKSAKRRLKQLSGRQSRFQTDTNHCISKALVAKARRHNLGIAIEDLSGISQRTTVRKAQRSRHLNWSFCELRIFLSYKAQLFGVPVQLIDPRYSSQECPACGHVSKSNRQTRDAFCCEQCGFSGSADHVAAMNIAARANVNTPTVSTMTTACYLPIAPSSDVRDKLPASAGSG
jgi:IS605 OrfB family transposase